MKNRNVGFLIIGMALVIFFLVTSFNQALATIVATTCTHGEACPMHVTLKTQKIISYSLIGVLTAVGLLVVFLIKDAPDKVKLSKSEQKKKLENLDDDERKIMNILLREHGSIYQSDLIKETKSSKVKITRLLDKVEGKGLIERKRRGMTNVIILR